MIDYPELCKRIKDHSFMGKTLQQFTEIELKLLISEILSCPGDVEPVDGWKNPSIDSDKRIILPFDCAPRYRWWTEGGQSLVETLIEIKMDYCDAVKYMDSKVNGFLTAAAYKAKVEEKKEYYPLHNKDKASRG